MLGQHQHVEALPVGPLRHLERRAVQPLRLRRVEARGAQVEPDHGEHRTRSNSYVLRSATGCCVLRSGEPPFGRASPIRVPSSAAPPGGCAARPRDRAASSTFVLRPTGENDVRRPTPVRVTGGTMPDAVIVVHRPQPDRAGRQGLARRRAARRPGRDHRQGRARQGARPSIPSEVEDLIMGCGQPAGEAGYNIARVVAILAGHARTSPASPSTATARRRCRPSAWPPTPSRPARATCSSPPASRR